MLDALRVYRLHTWRVFLSCLFVGRLAVPQWRHGSKARHVLLLPQARRAGVEAAEEGQYGDNGRRGAADQIEGACACTRRSLYGGAGGARDAGPTFHVRLDGELFSLRNAA